MTSGSRLQAWKDKYAAMYPGLDLSNQANPMHDGLTNLVKYALNLDPGQAEASSGVVIGTVLVGANHYLTLTFTHRTDDPTLTFSVLGANTSNATTWTAQTQSIPVDQSQVPSGMETEEFQDSVAIEDQNGPPRRFLKLQVTIGD